MTKRTLTPTSTNLILSLIGSGLFLLPLLYAWMMYPLELESPLTSYSALGGILPQSDASGYYHGATHFLETGTLDAWNTRRPLNAILFALRLWLTNNNFQATLILQALFCGVSCLWVATCVAKTFGKISGLFTLFILFLFAATFIPTTLSESLGLTLGSLGFVFLWQSIQQKETLTRWEWVTLGAGALLLTIGLNARAGAFFILPLLIMWYGFQFGKRAAGMIVAGIIGGIVFNATLTHLYSINSEGVAHGNFAPTLFGIVAGGKGWTYAYTLFPTLSSLSESMAAKFLYAQSLELFLDNPLLLFSGVFKGIWGLFKGLISFFQFKLTGSFLLKAFIRFWGILFLCVSIWRLKKLYPNYRKEIGLIVVGLLAMILSAGGIWVDGGFRVFATTVPFFAAAIGIAFGSLFRSNFVPTLHNQRFWETKMAAALSVFLILSSLGGPFLIKAFRDPIPNMTRLQSTSAYDQCQPNETLLIINAISGVPQLTLNAPANRFKANILRSIIEDKKPFLRILESDLLDKPMVLGLVYDRATHQTKYIFAPSQIFKSHQKLIKLCGVPIAGAENITQIKSFEELK